MTPPSESPIQPEPGSSPVRPLDLPPRERYRLLTSLVVPRPIGWVSTFGRDGTPNLAPFSFFNVISGNPPRVLLSISLRRGEPKDTVLNIREKGAFCLNVVSAPLLEAMNLTSAEVPLQVDEFELAGLTPLDGDEVDAPRVGEAPASLECVLTREMALEETTSILLIGEVKLIHLGPGLRVDPESWVVDPTSLDPVGRLGGDGYSLLGEVKILPRP